jgi:hypothetical protein
MSHDQPTVLLRPQVPMPFIRVWATAQAPRDSMQIVKKMATNQIFGGLRSMGEKTSSVTWE